MSEPLPIADTHAASPVRAPQSFASRAAASGHALRRRSVEALQVNIGRLCNQACKHCHVEAGPTKTVENMDRATIDRILDLVSREPEIRMVDITGGAPELNANFRYFARSLRSAGRHVIDRCNLTILGEPGQETTADFLADQGVEVIASLPCYSAANVDRQRGRGVFDRSIDGLRKLNALGYGHPETGLVLKLVFNPLGPALPPPQSDLQAAYKSELLETFGIVFNELITITNLPIKRFRWDLERSGRLDAYMRLLCDEFNPHVVNSVMCRSLVSIGWDGRLFDCDFNQMLDIPAGGDARTVWDIESFQTYVNATIAVGDHCYGCTAGAGSSCTGALI